MEEEPPLKPRAPRVPLDAELTFWRDGNHAAGRLTDLSQSGLFTTTDEPAPVGARLEISFTLPHDRSGKIVTGEVIVVRRTVEGRPGFGARFFRLPQAAARMIEEFLLRSASRSA
jgi:uncharacterized protein (TIGR02266 family)